MSKVGKFLLVVVGGLAIGTAAVAIPSVIYKNQRDYQDQQSKLQQASTNTKVSLVDTIKKDAVFASTIKNADIVFSGYNKSLFTVELVDMKTTLTKKASVAPAASGASTSAQNTEVKSLVANDEKGTLSFKYKIQSKQYKELFVVQESVIDGFKIKYIAPTVSASDEAAAQNTVKASITSAYSAITSKAENKLSDEQKTAINNYSTEVANGLGKEVSGVLKAVEGVLPTDQYNTVATLYTQVASELNKVLTTMLQEAITAKASTTGIEQIKAYLTPEKMGEIKNSVADVLNTNAETIANVGKAIFESLKKEESTMNIATLDTFVTQMTEFFKTQIQELAKSVKAITFEKGTAQTAALEKIQALLPGFKKEAAAKAKELLPNQADYDAVKAILKSKYEALVASAKSNVTLLVTETKSLAQLIDTLKLAQKPAENKTPGEDNKNSGEPRR
ncbi:hypothetical protein [Mycoplasma sp. CR]|uniref:hypothetical protein n=1 Tax=Mycoplasma sp. CR TaxID=3401693 RepID=UPI003AAA3CC2